MEWGSPQKEVLQKKHNIYCVYSDLRQHIPHLHVFLRTIYQKSQKAAHFLWVLEVEWILQKLQVTVLPSLPLVPYDPADMIVLDLSRR